MRLWSIHPSYLDTKGLVALWREGLLAKAVLSNKTRGYKNHPQLERFKAQADPVNSINSYLIEVQLEATRRGYNFDISKLDTPSPSNKIWVPHGQVLYELEHLHSKLVQRCEDSVIVDRVEGVLLDKTEIQLMQLFELVPGGIEKWEKVTIKENQI